LWGGDYFTFFANRFNRPQIAARSIFTEATMSDMVPRVTAIFPTCHGPRQAGRDRVY
jgi:hypothetical protein